MSLSERRSPTECGAESLTGSSTPDEAPWATSMDSIASSCGPVDFPPVFNQDLDPISNHFDLELGYAFQREQRRSHFDTFGDLSEQCIPSSTVTFSSEDHLLRDKPLLDFAKQTEYNILQTNGQRSYGGPPPTWIGPPPPQGSEIFVGKVPREILEDELVPLFEQAGRIYELRLMINFSGTNRGFFFVRYSSRGEASKAIKMFNNYEIRPGRFIGVVMSKDNRKLVLSGLPPSIDGEIIKADLKKLLSCFSGVKVFSEKGGFQKFCMVEFDNHRDAALAKKRLVPEGITVAGCRVKVDWARSDLLEGEQSKRNTKALLIRNLPSHLSKEGIVDFFSELSDGQVQNVNKFAHFAFVHFTNRAAAEKAFDKANGYRIQGLLNFEILWSNNKEQKVSRSDTGLSIANDKRMSLLKPPAYYFRGNQDPLYSFNYPSQENFFDTGMNWNEEVNNLGFFGCTAPFPIQ